jgi:hypothetical protein
MMNWRDALRVSRGLLVVLSTRSQICVAFARHLQETRGNCQNISGLPFDMLHTIQWPRRPRSWKVRCDASSLALALFVIRIRSNMLCAHCPDNSPHERYEPSTSECHARSHDQHARAPARLDTSSSNKVQ